MLDAIIEELKNDLKDYVSKGNSNSFVVKKRQSLIDQLSLVELKSYSNPLLDTIGEEINRITELDPDNQGFIIHVNNKQNAIQKALITINKF